MPKNKKSSHASKSKEIREFIRGSLSKNALEAYLQKEFNQAYYLQLDDVKKGIQHFAREQITGDNFSEEWLDLFWKDEFFFAIHGDEALGSLGEDFIDILYNEKNRPTLPSNDKEMLCFVFDCLDRVTITHAKESIEKVLDVLSVTIDWYQKHGFQADAVPDCFKECVILLNESSIEIKKHYRKVYKVWMEDLIKKKNAWALLQKGMALYFGSSGYEKNDKEALQVLQLYIKTVEEKQLKDDITKAAVLVGEIYRVGAYNDGIPDCEASLKYHALGLASGNTVSLLALADMLKDGKGVLKSVQSAKHLYIKVSMEGLKQIKDFESNNYFPEAALPLAKDAEKNEKLLIAYQLYLMGRKALAYRAKNSEVFLWDNKYLRMEYDQAIEDLEETLVIPKETTLIYQRPFLTDSFLKETDYCVYGINKIPGELNWYAVCVFSKNKDQALIPIPEFHDAFLAMGAMLLAKLRKMTITQKDGEVFFNHYTYDEKTKTLTMYDGEELIGSFVIDEVHLQPDWFIDEDKVFHSDEMDDDFLDGVLNSEELPF